jgi:hypothetical protein
MPQEKSFKGHGSGISKVSKSKPVALILAGYDKLDSETRRKRRREIIEAYDGDEIYMGRNKFLHNIAGKPIIQYVLDAVYNAKKNGKRLYERIYLYNDRRTFKRMIDDSKYSNFFLEQMKDSVGGHLKDFYFKYIDYGQRADIFFGDTPRITPEDVEWIHEEYNSILGKETDHRGITINMIYSIVEFEDLIKDNWLEHRIRYIKRGHNKGKLKNFVGFETFQARVGNSCAILKDECMDGLAENKAVNFLYNLRKALTPSNFSKIIYHLWKTKQFDMVRQIKRKCIKETEFIDSIFNVMSRVYKIDLSNFAGKMYHIKKNSARWENDVDGPRDLEVFRKRFAELAPPSL